MPHYYYFFVKNNGQENAKIGRTKVADWQHVGSEKSTPLSPSNGDHTARNSSHVKDSPPIVGPNIDTWLYLSGPFSGLDCSWSAT